MEAKSTGLEELGLGVKLSPVHISFLVVFFCLFLAMQHSMWGLP